MAEQELARKKRIRAGHISSTTRIMQAAEDTDSSHINPLDTETDGSTLQQKLSVIMKLDTEILDSTIEEDGIREEIEQADMYCERVELAIIALNFAISALEQCESDDLLTTAAQARDTVESNDEASTSHNIPENPTSRSMASSTPENSAPRSTTAPSASAE